MTDCNKVIKDIEYAKDLLQNRPEQDTVDYKVWEVLDDALDLIHDLRSQIAMLVGAQHAMCDLMKVETSERERKIILQSLINHEYETKTIVVSTELEDRLDDAERYDKYRQEVSNLKGNHNDALCKLR